MLNKVNLLEIEGYDIFKNCQLKLKVQPLFLGFLITMKFTTDMSQFINNLFGLPDSMVGEIITSALVLIAFIFLGWFVYHVFERYFTHWASKTKTKLDDEILKNIKKPIYFFVVVAGVYFGTEFLTALRPYAEIVDLIFLIVQAILVAFIITRINNVLTAWYAERRSKNKMNVHILYVLRTVINYVVYLFAFVYILWVRQIDLTGAAVGFGVGGIAIAFALQNVLSDFFSAFSIYFDKPFEIGDYIVVGEYSGTVKKIGMKSTRVQLLQGEELVLSNKELTSAAIRNFKKMKKRRINFSFGVTYNTPNEKLKKIPDIIKKIIDPEKLEYVESLDRVHFSEFGDFALTFDIVYYLKTQDYTKYKDTQQEINFAIREHFEKEGIEMAFPTQTIYLEK